MHASLVMQDKETDSYWSIMTGDSLAGSFQGTRLEELPLGTKTTWKDWRTRHPQTLVLSVDGVEHDENNPYDNYFASETSYRGREASDDRLPTKEAIYAFLLDGKAQAIPLTAFKDGAVFPVGDQSLFLYRPAEAPMFYSTAAFLAPKGHFEKREGQWYHASGARFEPASARFEPKIELASPGGFDTFWFNWSMTHPQTNILGVSSPAK